KWILNQKQNAKKEIHPSSKNFEAVVTFKLYCDEKDNLLLNKMSHERMDVAMRTNKDGYHFL
ncbi:hypothetical protein pdam_00024266, partial [Pocillopora damicornis]